MTNKLGVIKNGLTVPKIKKISLYEKKFLVPNYTCLHTSLTKGLPSPDPHSLCPLSSTEFVEHPPPPNKIPGYAIACDIVRKTEDVLKDIYKPLRIF